VHIPPVAEVSPPAHEGSGSRVRNEAQIREEAHIGCNCAIGKYVYVDPGVVLRDRVTASRTLWRPITRR
jgi:UDP-2-acetamido-3-amino-2,3-dideoxy-glucuronate N-acetyltransferase